MTVPVRYHCPRCSTIVTIARAPSLADKSVTPYPLSGWSYAAPDEDVEAADGVRFVCGDEAGLEGDEEGYDGAGCGEPFYLNYVRFERGREVEPVPEPEFVELRTGRRPPGPRWPGGPVGPG